jgi:hypothetical protein
MAGTRQRPFLLPNSSHPVGQKKPNHWGFYDMHGNVKEWCLDWDAFSRSPTNDLVNRLKAGRTDPTGPSTGTRLVLRGGSYGNSADYTINGGTILFHASACRDVFDPSKRKKGDVFMKEVGFRVAMNGSKAVVRVFLNGTLVTDAELVHLKGLNNLELLNLNDTTITGVGLVHLKGLTKLKILHLSNTKVSDAGLTHLKGLNNLSQLDVTDTNVTDTGLEHLKGLMNLRKLTLSRGKVTDAGVEKLQQVLPNCTIRHERLRFKGGGGGFF